MTVKELNRDIKRLLKLVASYTGKNLPDYHERIEKDVKPEFLRLYNADRSFEYMNKQSIIIMLRLNIRYRFEALHHFGLFINLRGVDN
jgi:hypothetical protein